MQGENWTLKRSPPKHSTSSGGPCISCPQRPVSRKCKAIAWALQLTFDLAQQIPNVMNRGTGTNHSTASQLEQCCCCRGRQKLWKSGGNPESKKQMGSKLYHLLTLLAQPQALWAPHTGKGEVVKEVEEVWKEECNNTKMQRHHLWLESLVLALCHCQLREISSPGRNMIWIGQESSNRKKYSSSVR